MASSRCPCTCADCTGRPHGITNREKNTFGVHISHFIAQKNPRAHKNKIGTSPPPQNPKYPPPPQNEEFYGHGFSCRTDAFFQTSIKLAQPFPAPELRTKILRTRGLFWIAVSYRYRQMTVELSFRGRCRDRCSLHRRDGSIVSEMICLPLLTQMQRNLQNQILSDRGRSRQSRWIQASRC